MTLQNVTYNESVFYGPKTEKEDAQSVQQLESQYVTLQLTSLEDDDFSLLPAGAASHLFVSESTNSGVNMPASGNLTEDSGGTSHSRQITRPVRPLKRLTIDNWDFKLPDRHPISTITTALQTLQTTTDLTFRNSNLHRSKAMTMYLPLVNCEGTSVKGTLG
ncbi:uncharacterized protein CPUR_04886 [Claviceps purpurea 20.1]|uniref:Uncharacterized protein n=1 Tax=Claviceps purpurea (strain 20.1) TaxID=1111077 RepID=M1W7H6_CLAP2|nr:uncharacterized protein CPUR_04886 [Claviceps purpurea 20.1]